MTYKLNDAQHLCKSLFDTLERYEDQGCNLQTTVVSVSAPGMKIIYVPAGCENNAKMELNER